MLYYDHWELSLRRLIPMMTIVVARVIRIQKHSQKYLVVTSKCCFSSEEELKENLAWSQYNWFDVVSNFLARCDGEDKVEAIILQLDNYYSSILISEMLDSEQHRLLQQSHDASVCDREGRLPLA